MSVTETPVYRFRWIHAPYTHTELAKIILDKIIKKMPPMQQRFDVVSDKFWLKKQNTATHSSPHARYLHSTCEFIDATVKDAPISEELRELLSEKGSKIVSSLSDYMSKSKEKERKRVHRQEDNDICKASQMILYLPYLHWESFKHLNKREVVIKERMKANRKLLRTANCMRNDPEPFERPPSIIDFPSTPDEKYPFGQTEAIPTAEQKSVEDDLINEVSTFKKIKGYIENSPELRFLWHHLIPGDLLHCRRSLDQYMYSTLPDTSARDKDQILHKCTRKGIGSLSNEAPDHEDVDSVHDQSNDVDETGNVLVVDQLWMWVLDDASVVTFFPPKEVELSTNKDKPTPAHSSAIDLDPSNFVSARLIAEGDLRTCIQREIEDSEDPFKNQWDLAAFIVKHVVTALFDRFEDSGPQALRNFAEYIDKLIEKQATSWASLNLRRGLSLADSSKEIKQVFQDLRDLRELRDVEDELRIITKILNKQNLHISKMQRMYDKHLNLGKSKGAAYLQETLGIIGRKQEQVRRMTMNMEMAKKGFEELISLQQNQISINQAVAAGKQSRAVTIFTVFTVFFLPLSFFTSLYGMNVSEWGGNAGTVSMKVILSTMLPLSFVVIVLAFLFAMNSSFREAVTSSFEILVECLIILIEFVSKWSGFVKLSTWLRKAKKSVGIGRIYAFKKAVKRHKIERRKARAEARTQKKRERKMRHRPSSVASGSDVPGLQGNGSGRRRKWMPFQRSGKQDEGLESDSDDDVDSFV
ncbi:uncharacterized protein BDZ99DRAFT_109846 [Mytilinidion resinicola]|uniref:Cora-domain-containing protein n=1 Tax=Mytilinidion resinicola TaxID=574789 RepID=A0A6A6YC68_9PEZI|nr:uncharacterized protein BDZ99DRAFT_109846 [Mytilinidion resinicola]KAF2805695.1 hypothetical protein BDZ99DRAFT_109846 [Mytilinidion resinicola]